MNRGRSSVMFVGFAAMATVACPLAAGCMAGNGEEIASEEAFDVPMTALTGGGDPDDPPTGHNPFPPSCFWDPGIQQTYRTLAGGPLATNTLGHLPNMPNMPPALTGITAYVSCRYSALKYLIQCALPQGSSVTDPANGMPYHGRFGLASTWKTQALTSTASKEWITSCLAAHLNNKGVSVTLLLEGNRSGFYFDTSLQTTYDERDSIAWGNIFDLGPLGNPQVHACYFSDLDAACTAPPEAEINDRMCDELPNCGLVLHGNCSSACNWNIFTGYWACDTVAQKTTNFRVRLADFSMYDTCGGP